MLLVLLFSFVATAFGDQCTSHVLDSGTRQGAHGIGCVNNGCCEDQWQISSLCDGDQVCCFSKDTCSGGAAATSTGDQCASHVLDSGSHKGAQGIGCVDNGCCADTLQIGSLCAGDKVCCFSSDTCKAPANTGGDQCASHVLDSGPNKGAHGIGCVDNGCCADTLQIGSLCSGNKVCCFSRDTCKGGGACSAEQRELACELFKSANVQTYKDHPSGVPDNAYGYNNLRDMCNGLKASRSSYSCNGCHAPGGSVCLSTGLLKYLVELKNHGKIIISELAGACHSCTSRHYSGLAVDLLNKARYSEYLQKCTAMGGWGQNEGDHIHCQFYDAPHPNGF